MTTTTTIYGLHETDSEQIRYVGATRSPLRQRLSQHRAQARHSHQSGYDSPKSEWVRSISPDRLEITALDYSCEQEAMDAYDDLLNARKANTRPAPRRARALSDEEAYQIKAIWYCDPSVSRKELGQEFSVGARTVGRAVNGEGSYDHVAEASPEERSPYL